MSKYNTTSLSTAGQLLKAEDGLPDMFLGVINEQWLKKKSDVVAVLLNSSSASEWIKLGEKLINLFNCEGLIGVALDGTIPNDAKKWIDHIASEKGQGIVGLVEHYTEHPIHSNTLIVNTTLFTLQHKSQVKWKDSVWNNISPNLFNGCDLMISSYTENKLPREINGQTFSMDSFLNTMSYAEAWIIPLDSYIGFIVGFQSDSIVSGKLKETLL